MKLCKPLFSLSAVAVLLLATMDSNAQESTSLQEWPLSHSMKSQTQSLPVLSIPALDMSKINSQDKASETLEKPYRFAITYKDRESYTDLGQWQHLDTHSIWRLSIDAKDTHSLSFGFKDVFLPQGAKLFIYGEDYSQLSAPFTAKNNNTERELWTPLVNGGKATIEIQVPRNLQQYVSFDLTDINQGYRGIDKFSIAKSGSCNIDVVCDVADPWRDEIRSVARYTFNKDGSTFLCTGTLVNNVAADRKPYFLTANHCVSNETVANSMVLYWNYEATACDGMRSGSLSENQSGATLRATWPVSDMTLVELNDDPNSSYNVHWAGWDNTDTAASSAVAIHHPAGHEKRISFEDDALTITNYSSDTSNVNGTHLRVDAWDQGTTEGGSSGSGIWNSAHHVVGTLHGGFASCSAPNEPDWYGRLALQWMGGGSADSQLKAWLDPADTGAVTLDGTDACTAPTVSIDSITPNPAEVGEVVTFSSTASGGSGSGYTFAWDFDGNGSTDSTQEDPTFTYSAAYTGNVSLSVTDSASCSKSATSAMVVEVPNRAPVASVASPAFTVNEGSNVSLDASSSSDPDGDNLTYAWAQTSGAVVTLSNASSSVASFTAPQVTATTDFVFEVTVSDPDGLNSKATVTVSVTENQAPTAAVASSSITVNEGTAVSLNASSSSDPDGDALTYSWTQTSGNTVTLNSATSSIASFTAPQVTAASTFEFEVMVSDPSGESSTATVTVTVNDVPAPPPSSGGGGGSTGLGVLLFLGLAAIRRKSKVKA